MKPRTESVLRKSRESAATQEKFFAENAERIVACAEEMAAAFDRGGRLYVLGNGGSACDAAHLAVEFMHPVVEKRKPLPALSLVAETPLLTAVANDQDFALAFVEQLRVLARPGDMALGISTSGKSAGVVRALRAARDMGLLTIAFSGRDGGALAEGPAHCFTVPSFNIHRIQETHVALLHVLWDLVHVARGEEDVL
ncbi:MAG TPA: SIS domain-containing protein [Planctomycetota bacterium]|nr:SIS domain-containing protein [Planctomycetota bacterium]